MIGVLDTDLIDAVSVGAGEIKITEVIGNAGVDAESFQSRVDAQNILRDISESPRRSAGQLAVLALSEIGRFRTCDHL